MKMFNTLVAFIMIIGSSGCSQEKMNKHIDSKYEIAFPESWAKQQKGTATFFLSPKQNEKDLFQENINIIIQDLSSQPMTLEDYTNLTKQQVIQAFGSSAIVSIKDLNVAGQQAKEMVYTMPKNPIQGRNQNLKLRQLWFIKGNNTYLLTYTAQSSEYDKFLETAKAIFDSFKLKE
jgi:serine/threonine-protein kinase